MSQSRPTANDLDANPITMGALVAGVLLLAIGALVLLQAGGTDRGQEHVGQALIGVAMLCWLAVFVLLGVRHEADRVLAVLAADRSRGTTDPSA